MLLVMPAQGSDYQPMDTQVIFTTGAVNLETECITISIFEDDHFEDNHAFQVQISSITPPIASAILIIAPVTIQDNNGKLCA